MLNNVGKKIKIVATVFACLLLICAVILLLISFVRFSEYLSYSGSFGWHCRQEGIWLLCGGLGVAGFAVVSCLPLYGFGQLIENTDFIALHLKKETEKAPDIESEKASS